MSVLSADIIETLVYFGLSPNQAKVFLSVDSKQFSNVSKIQKSSHVPRQEIYKVLEKLIELGLVESSLERPKKYRSISVKEGITFLLKRRNEETSIMNEKAELLLKNVGNNNVDSLNGFEPDFVLIPKNHATIVRRKEEISTAKSQIDFLVSWKRFPQTVLTFADAAKIAFDNGVRIRVLLEKPENIYNIPEIVNKLKNYSKYELKFISHEPSAMIAIFDKKKVIMDISIDSGLAEKPSLLSNNPSLVSIMIDYFDKIWEDVLNIY